MDDTWTLADTLDLLKKQCKEAGLPVFCAVVYEHHQIEVYMSKIRSYQLKAIHLAACEDSEDYYLSIVNTAKYIFDNPQNFLKNKK